MRQIVAILALSLFASAQYAPSIRGRYSLAVAPSDTDVICWDGPNAAWAPCSVTLPVRDVFTSAQASYTLSAAPVSSVYVYLNGLLQMQAADYSLFGQSLTFVTDTTAMADRITVQAVYRRAP